MNYQHILKIALLVFMNIICLHLYASQNLFQPINLKCNYWESPYGIDQAKPNLSWTIQVPEGRRGVFQTAYQVLVANSLDILKGGHGNLWNSGRIKSDQMLQIGYLGSPITSNQQCWWMVRVWDENGRVSAWSQAAQWTMGIINPEGWISMKEK